MNLKMINREAALDAIEDGKMSILSVRYRWTVQCCCGIC